MKNYVLILLLIILFTGCATSRKSSMPKVKRKKCGTCPSFSYIPQESKYEKIA